MTQITRAEETNATVLLVEDSTTQALHFQSLLEENGVSVLWASDGESGLEMAQQHTPDLIVLDIQLPKMNGFEVCQRLKEMSTTAEIPVIMLTRFDEAESVVQGLQAGAIDYIPKDAFAGAVLLETLRQMGIIQR
jgi:DNA-binding response OmpR family regulator